jgi:hypothetical protein
MNDIELKMKKTQMPTEDERIATPEETTPLKNEKSYDTEIEKNHNFPKLNSSYDEWITRLKENAKKVVQEKEEKKEKTESPIVQIPPNDSLSIKDSETKKMDKEIDLPFLDVDHTKTNDNVSLNKIEKSKLLSLSKKILVLDPGSANRLYFEGVLGQFNQALMVKSSAKRLQADVARHLQQIDLNAQDLSRAQLFQERLETLEEAGKALALCKKKRINIYITSYRLPPSLQKIQIIHVADLIKDS